jgi:hypothetical protein
LSVHAARRELKKERRLALHPLGMSQGDESKESAPGASKNTGDDACLAHRTARDAHGLFEI